MTDDIRDRIDSTIDKGTGEGKEAFGKATDRADLEREGRTDEAKGEAEGGLADLKEKGSDLLKKVTGGK